MLRMLCFLLYSVDCMLRTGASRCTINRECGSILVIRRLDYTSFTTTYDPPAHPPPPFFFKGIISVLLSFIVLFMYFEYYFHDKLITVFCMLRG